MEKKPIDFAKYKVLKEHRERPEPESKIDLELSERCARIAQSVTRINNLIDELRSERTKLRPIT